MLVSIPPGPAAAAEPAPSPLYVRKQGNLVDAGAHRRAPIRVKESDLFQLAPRRAAAGAPSQVLAAAAKAGGKGFRAAGLQPVRLGRTDAFVVTGRSASGRAAMLLVDTRGRVLAQREHVAASEVPDGTRLGRRVRTAGAMVWRTQVGRSVTYSVSGVASHMTALEQARGMERPEEDEYAPMTPVSRDGVGMERPEEDERGDDGVGMERPEEDEHGGDGLGMERPEEDERDGDGLGMERPEEDEFPVGVWVFQATNPQVALDATVNNGTAVLAPALAPPTMAFPAQSPKRVFR